MASTGARARARGHGYELKVIKELTALGYLGLKSSRSESRNLDNDLIDIADTQNQLPLYFLIKCTKSTPNYHQIITECPRKDRPIVVVHNKQESRETKQVSVGEYVTMDKGFFYKLLKCYTDNEKLNDNTDTVGK